MVETKRISLASITSSSSNYIRFQMLEYDNSVDRRIQALKSLSGGDLVDLGIHDNDRVITGKAVLTSSQASVLEGMFESSTSFWHLSDGENLYRVGIQRAKFEKMLNKKYVYDCVFLVKQKDN